jgi:hypothetical protein
MGYVSKEWLKEHECQIFMYQKADDGSEGVLPVNIDDLPEAERREGVWIEGEESEGACGIKYTEWKCSECGWASSHIMPRNYCPKCGSKNITLKPCDKLCKYYESVEGCLFWFMGSGRPQDMPCARG